ncbi:NAD(P)-binding protein [Zopfia rhizophila CBS 207.26]|uniref:NAD(P)-binding protein n=1 Tax=Zopfia rhizophila CBS 207.26 TaxID=1314779 RepID=A0A6A6DHD4_9PEZI|nr:NAD(P)-binding protein [Zopfia rhizophila CBS 207.26]
MRSKVALVIRATGSQGTAVTRHLLGSGWTVHAFVNDPENPRALALKDIGAELYKGSLSDSSSVQAAIQGCTAVFLNQMPSFTDDAETREAQSVLNLAKAAGVKHVVHSTTLPLNDPSIATKIAGSPVAPAVLDKGKVERLVQDSGITWTIIRPGYFMTNLIAPLAAYMFPELSHGKLVNGYGPGCVLPLIDPDNIGAFAVMAFNDPSRFSGNIISVAGEKLSIEDITKELSRASGKEVKAVYRTDEEMEKDKSNVLAEGQKLSIGLDKLVDLEEVKTYGILLTSFRDFLQQHKEAVLA